MAIGLTFASVFEVTAQDAGSPTFWDGFYLAILGGARTQTASVPDSGASANVGVAAGAGKVANELFYYGAEAFLAAHNVSKDEPFLWLEADGRLGARVTKQMLLYTSAGVGYDAGERQLALNGAAAADLALNQRMAVQAQYSLAHYLEGGGTVHGATTGVVYRLN